MTRTERLARSTARAAQRTATAKAAEAKARAKQRTQERQDLEKRCALVGHLAHEAGLLAWEDGTLAQLFALLATLRETPDPVGTLDGLLHDGAVSHQMTMDEVRMVHGEICTAGMAHAHPGGGVAAARRKGMETP